MIGFQGSILPPIWTDRPADPYAAGMLNRLLDRHPGAPSWEVVKQRLIVHAEEDVTVYFAGTVFTPVRRIRAGESAELVPSGTGWRDYAIAVPKNEAGTPRWVRPGGWNYTTLTRVRAGGGPEYVDGCLDGVFRVVDSDRLGIRLERLGPAPKAMDPILSAPVGWGTIQLPPDGHPIILGPDAASTGGYPRVGWVVPEDVRVLGQTGIGVRIEVVVSATNT